MIDAPTGVAALLASRPRQQFIADLFTFELANGTTYRFNSSPRAVTVDGVLYPTQNAKVIRGRVKLSRGLSIDSQQVTLNEQNGAFLSAVMDGLFNLSTYTLGRTFAASAVSPWSSPVTRFKGQIAQFDEIGRSYAKMTAKSMLNLLNNDFPRILLQSDCPHVLFGPGCGLRRSDYLVAGVVGANPTGNTVPSNIGGKAAGYFAQGIITFTSGALDGLSYMVKASSASGTIYPAYPLLYTPAAGDTFNVSPGCDKTLGTCQAKYGFVFTSGVAPFFLGTPFIPDPTTAY